MAIQALVNSHPSAGNVDVQGLAECIQACFDCAAACSLCADACLSEPKVAELRECIASDLACAEVCLATGRALTHLAKIETSAQDAQLEACAALCRTCGDECAKHAEMHEHCKICAEACRRCEQSCMNLLQGAAAR